MKEVSTSDYGKKMALDIEGQAAAFRSDFHVNKQINKRKQPTGAASPQKDRQGNKLQVSKEILRQLGGNKFLAMTGAKNMAGDKNILTFRLPKAKDGINHVEIKLSSLDTYDLTFSRVMMSLKRGPSIKTKVKINNVYGDRLKQAFETATGLYTSL